MKVFGEGILFAHECTIKNEDKEDDIKNDKTKQEEDEEDYQMKQ